MIAVSSVELRVDGTFDDASEVATTSDELVFLEELNIIRQIRGRVHFTWMVKPVTMNIYIHTVGTGFLSYYVRDSEVPL